MNIDILLDGIHCYGHNFLKLVSNPTRILFFLNLCESWQFLYCITFLRETTLRFMLYGMDMSPCNVLNILHCMLLCSKFKDELDKLGKMLVDLKVSHLQFFFKK